MGRLSCNLSDDQTKVGVTETTLTDRVKRSFYRRSLHQSVVNSRSSAAEDIFIVTELGKNVPHMGVPSFKSCKSAAMRP